MMEPRPQQMEPLSEVLALLKPRAYMVHALDAGGDWSIRFCPPGNSGIKFTAIQQGECWLLIEGGNHPHHLVAGDCFLLTTGRPFIMASDPSLPAVDAMQALSFDASGIARCHNGGKCFMISALFSFAGDYVGTLFGTLPPIVPVRAASNEASVLRWALDLFTKEIRRAQPGGSLTVEHLAHIMLIQVLRLHLASADASRSGWLFALNDSQLSAAICAIHSDLRRRWTLEAMARTAGMSRSSFAEKFKHVVGRAPLEYLTRWRMHVAADRLRATGASTADIAHEVGYASEAAFSTAFKKIHGHSPRFHRRAPSAEPHAQAAD
jgi:AraC-like DNA-binding protein